MPTPRQIELARRKAQTAIPLAEVVIRDGQLAERRTDNFLELQGFRVMVDRERRNDTKLCLWQPDGRSPFGVRQTPIYYFGYGNADYNNRAMIEVRRQYDARVDLLMNARLEADRIEANRNRELAATNFNERLREGRQFYTALSPLPHVYLPAVTMGQRATNDSQLDYAQVPWLLTPPQFGAFMAERTNARLVNGSGGNTYIDNRMIYIALDHRIDRANPYYNSDPNYDRTTIPVAWQRDRVIPALTDPELHQAHRAGLAHPVRVLNPFRIISRWLDAAVFALLGMTDWATAVGLDYNDPDPNPLSRWIDIDAHTIVSLRVGDERLWFSRTPDYDYQPNALINGHFDAPGGRGFWRAWTIQPTPETILNALHLDATHPCFLPVVPEASWRSNINVVNPVTSTYILPTVV
jgi:hypothetical protein